MAMEEKSKNEEVKMDDTVKTAVNNNSITTKARYWVAVGWTENMRPDWQDRIDTILQLPFAYVIHDKDVDSKGQPRPVHVHIILAFNSPTTYKNAMSVFKSLEIDGKIAFNTAFKVNHIRNMYEYIIHATDDAKRKRKHLYDATERICGNGFDIGNYEQISQADKDRMLDELEDVIFERRFVTYGQYFMYVKHHMSAEHRKILRSYSSHLERLVRSNYVEIERSRKLDDGENRNVPL